MACEIGCTECEIGNSGALNVKKNITYDIWDLLDNCRQCGGVPGFGKDWRGRWVAGCTECANITNSYEKQFEAMVEWNREQRKGVRHDS